MKDPDFIETTFEVCRDNGEPYDHHENNHKTLEEALDYFETLDLNPNVEWEIVETTVITTIHPIEK